MLLSLYEEKVVWRSRALFDNSSHVRKLSVNSCVVLCEPHLECDLPDPQEEVESKEFLREKQKGLLLPVS